MQFKDFLKFSCFVFCKIAIVFLGLFLFRALLIQEIDFSGCRNLLVSSTLLVMSSWFFSKDSNFSKNFLLLFLVLVSVFMIKIFSLEFLGLVDFNRLTGFAIASANFLLLWIAFSNQSNIFRTINKFLVIVFLFPVLFIWGYYFSSGAWLNAEAVMAVLQTNFNEGKEYLADFLGITDWLIIFGIAIFILYVANFTGRLRKNKKIPSKFVFGVLIVLLSSNALFIYRCRNNIVTDIVVQTTKFVEQYKNFEDKRIARKEKVKSSFSEIADVPSGVFVLVIGESQNRDNMSAYGYERKTTPWLDEIKDKSNVVFFENAYSCHTHTVPVLTYALTAKNQYNSLELSKANSLFEVVEAAGFETIWISNQVKYGAWDTPVTVIADEANQQFWYNKNVGETCGTQYYDMQLLDALDKIKMSEKMLIVFHLMGSHGSYKERYPKEFNTFKGEEVLDAYDNSIFYNDYLMKNLYEKVKGIANFKGLIYFADHADDAKNNLGHNASNFTFSMAHIPMYMYFSEEYIEDNALKFLNLVSAEKSVITNDLMFNTVLGVLNIKIDGIYENKNDITSESYDDDINRFKTLYGKKSIVEDRK